MSNDVCTSHNNTEDMKEAAALIILWMHFNLKLSTNHLHFCENDFFFKKYGCPTVVVSIFSTRSNSGHDKRFCSKIGVLDIVN